MGFTEKVTYYLDLGPRVSPEGEGYPRVEVRCLYAHYAVLSFYLHKEKDCYPEFLTAVSEDTICALVPEEHAGPYMILVSALTSGELRGKNATSACWVLFNRFILDEEIPLPKESWVYSGRKAAIAKQFGVVAGE